MYWEDEGYLLSKTNFDENSIIIEVFTLNHGKCSGVIYGGSSKKLPNPESLMSSISPTPSGHNPNMPSPFSKPTRVYLPEMQI